MPHPGFPTDMQPLMTVLLTLAKGTSIITEGIWENRFRYVDELTRMGANIQVDGRVAVIEGVQELLPAPMRAADLRAGAALVVARWRRTAFPEVDEICHHERGYEISWKSCGGSARTSSGWKSPRACCGRLRCKLTKSRTEGAFRLLPFLNVKREAAHGAFYHAVFRFLGQ